MWDVGQTQFIHRNKSLQTARAFLHGTVNKRGDVAFESCRCVKAEEVEESKQHQQQDITHTHTIIITPPVNRS